MTWNFQSPHDPILHKWSMARQEICEECERKYYYHYRALSKDSKHSQKNEIAALKRRRTLPRLKAEIVHASIADFIRGEMSTDGKISPYVEKRWLKIMGDPADILLEFINGRGLSAAMIEQARLDCLKLADSFLDVWPTYGKDEILYVDNPDDYPGWFLSGSIGIYARPNLILKRDKYLVVNWKTGQQPDDFADNNIEMSMSIYLACFDYVGNIRAYPEEFEGIFVYLPSKKISQKISKTSDEFEQFAELIDEKLAALPESLMEEHYLPDPARWKCRSCNFATICHDGRQNLDL